MGQNMGQKCGLATGQPNRQLSPPILDLRHIQDHFGFTFLRGALTRFSEGFYSLFSGLLPMPGGFLPLPVISCSGSNMGQKHGKYSEYVNSALQPLLSNLSPDFPAQESGVYIERGRWHGCHRPLLGIWIFCCLQQNHGSSMSSHCAYSVVFFSHAIPLISMSAYWSPLPSAAVFQPVKR